MANKMTHTVRAELANAQGLRTARLRSDRERG